MRKCTIGLIILASIILCACQNSSNQLLTYEDSLSVSGRFIDNQLTEGEFFAEDLAIITEEDDFIIDELLSSGATLLVNVTDEKVIYADHEFDKLYPASLTKLLTALVALRYGELTDNVTISYNASHIKEGNAKLCGFEEGDVISLESLLYCMLIYSGNDAALAVAEHISGSEEKFVAKMNETAVQIGAVHSNFMNSHGLHDDNHYTTAYDIYLIINELIKYDTFRSIINSASYTAEYTDKDLKEKQRTYLSTNLFITGEEELEADYEVIGGKTGSTRKAGNCLALVSKSTKGKEYISIILNATDRDNLYSQMSHLISKASVQ